MKSSIISSSLACFALLAGCSAPPSPPDVVSDGESVASTASALTTATITASPSTVLVPPSTGVANSRICWSIHDIGAPVWIRVRVNHEPGGLFTKESDNGSACENAPWIQAGSTYDFEIHTSNNDTSPMLATVRVYGVSGGDGTTGGTTGGGCGAGNQQCAPGNDCHCGDRCRPTRAACP